MQGCIVGVTWRTRKAALQEKLQRLGNSLAAHGATSNTKRLFWPYRSPTSRSSVGMAGAAYEGEVMVCAQCEGGSCAQGMNLDHSNKYSTLSLQTLCTSGQYCCAVLSADGALHCSRFSPTWSVVPSNIFWQGLFYGTQWKSQKPVQCNKSCGIAKMCRPWNRVKL